MERLTKSLNGQWKLIREILKKDDHPLYPKKTAIVNEAGGHPVYSERDSKKPAPVAAAPVAAAPAAPVAAAPAEVTSATADAAKVNRDRLTAQFHAMHKHIGDSSNFGAEKGKLKADLLAAPKGSIDIGHLGDLKELGDKLNPKDEQGNKGFIGRFSDEDMADVINHHAGDIKDLKEFYDKHGKKGLRTLLRTHGMNGSDRGYSHLNLKPGINEDLNELVGQGYKSNQDREDLDLSDSEYGSLHGPSGDPDDEKLHDLHNKAFSGHDNETYGQDGPVKALEKYVLDRSMEKFNKRHGIADDPKGDDAVKKSILVEATQEQLEKQYESKMEELAKKCPRCGSASANASNPSGRCRKHLSKLSADKKKPGHWQRAQTKADDALRRQKGKNGTASKKSSGLGNRKSIVKQTQSAEKKHGQKLSPDRKDNGKGYAASNTRMVPEKLNRGRHKVDPKKLKAWRDRMKKSQLDADIMYTSLLAKAHEINNQELVTLLGALTPPEVIELMSALESFEPLRKKSEEECAEVLIKAIKDEVGTTHTVEVHPDIDHLYRAKGILQDSGKDKMHISGFKKSGMAPNIVDKIPRDGSGSVTPGMIDGHIASLPKSKIDVHIMPYLRDEQKHRPQSKQFVLSMRLHPDEKAKMNLGKRGEAAFDHMKNSQHTWGGDFDDSKAKDQIGWVRVDPHKNIPAGNGYHSPEEHDHWHIDEIQSDFQNKKKIKSRLPYTIDEDIETMLGNLSHGHEDPQHLLHSVANALGRRLGVKSTSMDMPKDQARKNDLDGFRRGSAALGAAERQMRTPTYRTPEGWNRIVDQHIQTSGIPEEHSDAVWSKYGKGLHDEHMENEPDFKSAVDKLGPDKLKEFSQLAHSRTTGFMFDGEAGRGWDDASNSTSASPELSEKLKNMSNDEKNALSSFLLKHSGNIQQHIADIHNLGERPAADTPYTYTQAADPIPDEPREEEKPVPLPVHQISTYDKRPRNLGMVPVDKDSLLGPSESDVGRQIQYAKLHKKIQTVHEQIAELKKNR